MVEDVNMLITGMGILSNVRGERKKELLNLTKEIIYWMIMKKKNNRVIREIIKINVIMDYGKTGAEIVADILQAKDTDDKLSSIYTLISMRMAQKSIFTKEQILFIIQKLLSYPFKVRLSISNQILERLKQKEILNSPG